MFRTIARLVAVSSALWLAYPCQAARLDADDSHTCTVVDGGVRCWGDNDLGSLGVPGLPDSALAVDVLGLEPGRGLGVTAVTTGGGASCAVLQEGLLCWGNNFSGVLGNGSTQDSFLPVPVSGLEPGGGHGVTAASIGTQHACAVAAGGVLCWGRNDEGQLGDGTAQPHFEPSPVSGLEPGTGKGVVAVSTGEYHSCASGLFGVKCWGRNQHPVFGPQHQSAVPLLIPNLAGPISIMDVADQSTCVVSGGQLKCWGPAPLGNGTNTGSDTPVTIDTLPAPITAISLGQNPAMGMRHGCVIAFSTAYCWGGGGYGQLGNGNPADHLLPQAVPGFGAATGTVSEIAAGAMHTCGIHSSAGLRCWGAIGLGLVGNGRYARQLTPYPVAAPATSGVTQLSAADAHTCALIDGKVWCWGANAKGELGDGSFQLRRAPVEVSGLDNVISISTGDRHSCAVRAGQVWCWGSNSDGQLGRDPANLTSSSLPLIVPGIAQAVAVHGGYADHTCATTASGALYCWGSNTAGQTGASNPDGTPNTTSSWQPTQVFASSVTAAAVGLGHSCAIVAGGAACWGADGFGQLGNGPGTGGPQPSQVSGLGPGSGATALSASIGNTCAIANGGVTCWGYDHLSSLAGMPTFAQTPQEVGLPAGSGASAIATSISTTCAIVDGAAHCWGSGTTGALGTGDALHRTQPAPVSGLDADVTSIVTTGYHSCAASAGVATCWGWILDGRLGNFATGVQGTPAPVLAEDLFRSGFE